MQFGEQKLGHGFTVHHGEVAAWRPEILADLKLEDLEIFNNKPPEVLLIGTGRRTIFPDSAIMQALADAHIGYEFMDSRAAARTYNVLVDEGRDVSIAMLLPGVG